MPTQISNPTEIKILSAAKNLFWKYGIRKVSVLEICKEAGISKMTFYRYFDNKSEVALAFINKLFTNSHRKYRKIMDEDVPFKMKVVELVKMKQEDVEGISQEMIIDIFESKDDNLKKLILGFKENMRHEIMQDLALAQKKGEIRKDLKLEFILYVMDDMDKKLLDENLNKMYKNEGELIMELTNFFFYGILP